MSRKVKRGTVAPPSKLRMEWVLTGIPDGTELSDDTKNALAWMRQRDMAVLAQQVGNYKHTGRWSKLEADTIGKCVAFLREDTILKPKETKQAEEPHGEEDEAEVDSESDGEA